MANLDQIISYLGDNHFTIELFNTSALSITSGTIGTSWNWTSINIAKTGKKPLAVWLAKHDHPGNYNMIPRWDGSSNTVYMQVYRAASAAVNAPAGDTALAVLYIDDNQS